MHCLIVAGEVTHIDKDVNALEVRKDDTNDNNAQARLRASVEQNAAQRERFREGRDPSEPDLVEQAKETVELRRQSCEAARAKLTQFNDARRLYTLDEEGAKVYLDAEQTAQAKADVEAAIAEHCD